MVEYKKLVHKEKCDYLCKSRAIIKNVTTLTQFQGTAQKYPKTRLDKKNYKYSVTTKLFYRKNVFMFKSPGSIVSFPMVNIMNQLTKQGKHKKISVESI